MPTTDPIYIVKGEVTDLDAYEAENAERMATGRAMVALGDPEWQFSDGPPGARGSSDDFIDLIEGLRAYAGRPLIWVAENDLPSEPAPEPERRAYEVTLYASRSLYRRVKIYEAVSPQQAREMALAMPDDDLTDADWTEMDEIIPCDGDTADVELVENNA